MVDGGFIASNGKLEVSLRDYVVVRARGVRGGHCDDVSVFKDLLKRLETCVSIVCSSSFGAMWLRMCVGNEARSEVQRVYISGDLKLISPCK